MTKPRSNSRRFVNAAWSLLTFQLIASAGAVGVTGLAAFHVSGLVNGSQQAGKPPDVAVAVEEAVPGEEATVAPTTPPAATTAPATEATASVSEQVRPFNDGPGTLSLAPDQRGNINASLSDPDGISSGPRIQWMRNGAPLPNAAGPTYTVRYEDSQSAISARADYVDGDGFQESVVSQPVQIGVIIP